MMVWSLQALLFISALSVVSARIFTDEQVSKLETFVEGVMKCRQIPGQTVAVVVEDETWVRGFGLADIEQGVNVTKDTLFGIGSLTKAFTTTLLAMMMDESNGSITWTTKVKDILGPDFAFVDEERTGKATLRDLLTHRAGLHPAKYAISAGFPQNFTLAELQKRFRYLPEVHSFRDVYEYNNWPYALIGRIVELLSGEPFEVTLEKRLFKPLGMKHSRVLGKTISANDTGMAKPYYNVENKLVLTDPSVYDIHPLDAGGGIASSAEDMAKWMHFLLRQGVTEDNVTLVDYTTLVEVFKFHEYMPYGALASKPKYPVMNLEYGYGYAWYLSVYKEYNVSMHTGELNSYTSYIKLYRDFDIGIFVSESGPGSTYASFTENLISFYISDILLADEPWLNVSTACSYPQPWGTWLSTLQNNSDVTNTDVECLDCYIGKYGHRLFGDVDVKKGPGASLELFYGRLRGSLNTTDKEATFKLDLWEPFRFYARPGNATMLVEVIFHGFNNGKYSFVVFGYPHTMTFTRGISFYNEIIFTTINPEISGQGVEEMSSFLLVFASLCAAFSILY
ncbi:uncharacterized protein [Haliotis asinina]|uniref:uncharacterized protein n=1 Tax=Haliotis asinina TaxID=109174 RepID=UPI0035323668